MEFALLPLLLIQKAPDVLRRAGLRSISINQDQREPKLERPVKKMRSGESGQAVMPMVLLCMTVLLGFAGLATDVGTLFREKRLVQTAADSAAIAGAAELFYGDTATGAKADASRNGVTNGTNGGTVTVNNPPLSGPHSGNSSYVEVLVSQSAPTFFMNVFGKSSVTVGARAVAMLGAGQTCIVTLGTSGTDILLNGSVSLQATQCMISDDSSSSTALLANGTNTINAKSIGVVGSVLQNGINTITPAPTTGIVPVSDPLAFLSPPSVGACNYTNFVVNGSVTQTLYPGVYCGGITLNGNPNVTFSAGVYIVNGGSVTDNGSTTIHGSGVTFYLTNGAALTVNGGNSLNLTAPTSGTYNGILFFQDPNDSAAATINGSNNSALQGIFYFPSAQLTINGGGSTQFYTDFVTKMITLNGSTTLKDYATINGASPIRAAALVE